YLETFNLSPGSNISYSDLLQTHLIRWLLWILVSIPASICAWKIFVVQKELTLRKWVLISSIYSGSSVLSLILLAIQAIVVQDASIIEFGEFFEFFIYQKGLSFFMASLILILLLFHVAKSQRISHQEIEIESLARKTSDLEEILSKPKIPHLNIKIGHKMALVALEEIIWIQSDDYCVKIHTKNRTYTLRQSLKSLESKLASYRFIRIHRSALVNLNYLDQINYEKARVTLSNKTELPFSKSGIKSLKENFTDVAN
ncbi:MAG: LytTR family transcriptional regulator DNA-binding domain-containing protein, partial [Ekhidna sp.]|nr:LytTR family transcriptional regulator DNA-binding domain-containing protein [Ekhidna sp.]